MSSPLMAHHCPKSWKGAVSAPAPHRGGYRGVGDFGDMLFSPMTILGVCNSSPRRSLLGRCVAYGARSAYYRSATMSHRSLVDVGESHHGPGRSSPSA